MKNLCRPNDPAALRQSHVLPAGGLCIWWALATAAALPTAVHAQGAPSATDEQAVQSITVTSARKRKELIQDVPISMDVLTSKELKDSGVADVKALQYNVPGLAIQSYEAGGRTSLRGVGSQTAGLGTDASVAVHLDGVYQGLSATALSRLFDADRVEVLRGPQGTLYGRNASGGVMNIVTRAPGKVFGGNADVSYGSYGTLQLEGGLDIPLGAESAVRVSFAKADGDGRITNTFDGSKVGKEDFDAARLRLKSRLGAVDFDLSAQTIRDRSTQGVALVAPPSVATNVPYGPRFRAPTSLGYEKTYSERQSRSPKQDDNLSMTLTGSVGELTLKSITGYSKHKSTQDFDCSPGNTFKCGLFIDTDYDQTSQELQAQFTSGPVDWVVGAYYFKSEGAEHRIIDIPAFTPPGRVLRDGRPVVSAKASALFVDANWQLAPRWRLNPGLRFNQETKGATFRGTGSGDNPNTITAERSFNDVTGKIGIDHQPNKDTLYYASLSKGFKSGGVLGAPTTATSTELVSYRPETLYALETGFKRVLPGNAGRVNASVFYYDYRDLQVQVGEFNPNTNTFVFATTNAAKSRVYGLDFLAELKVSTAVSVDVSGELLSARYLEFQTRTSRNVPVDYTGFTLQRAPKVSVAAGLNATKLSLGQGLFGSFRLEYTYRSKVYFDQDNNAPFLSQDGFGLVNASLRIEPLGSTWSVYLTGRNLANKKTIDFASSALNVPGQFRTVNIGATYKF
jgi:iron complex outermembrane receptor protein